MTANKTVLFVPFNATGHINIPVGLADRLRDDYGYRTIFLLVEPAVSSVILAHKHELVTVKRIKSKNSSVVETNGSENGDFRKNGDAPTNEVSLKIGKNTPKLAETTMKMNKVFQLEPVDRLLEVMKTFAAVFIEEAEETMEQYMEEVKRIKPDLLVTEYLLYLPQFRETIGNTPWVYLYPANPFPYTVSKVPDLDRFPGQVGVSLLKSKTVREKLRAEKPDEWRALVDGWKRIQEKLVENDYYTLPEFHEFQNRYGITEKFELFHSSYDSPYLNIYVMPAEIDYDQEDDLCAYRERWIRCDSFIRKSENLTSPSEAALWAEKIDKALLGKKELVYFSLGTLASGDLNLMRMYINFLKEDTKRLYVISKGSEGDELKLCEENMIGANYVPQNFILNRANLAIIHGGNNSLTECLYNGVPMIVLPVFADQLDNAQRIHDLELGKRLDVHNCKKEELLNAIDDVLSDHLLIERYKEISRSMKARDDPGKLSFMLKKLIENGNLDQVFIEQCQMINSLSKLHLQ